jgi:hypothetical protein
MFAFKTYFIFKKLINYGYIQMGKEVGARRTESRRQRTEDRGREVEKMRRSEGKKISSRE